MIFRRTIACLRIFSPLCGRERAPFHIDVHQRAGNRQPMRILRQASISRFRKSP